MRRFWIALVVANWAWAIGFVACTQAPIAPQPDPGCPGACAQLAALQCPEGDSECQDWCETYHSVGYMRPFSDCVSVAGDVESVRACGVRCEQ